MGRRNTYPIWCSSGLRPPRASLMLLIERCSLRSHTCAIPDIKMRAQIHIANAYVKNFCCALCLHGFGYWRRIFLYIHLILTSPLWVAKLSRSVENLWSYAGLVPKTQQSGSKEWRGHITKGNVFLKYLLMVLMEVVQIHIIQCPDSPVAFAYNRVKVRAGSKKARVAAARHLLRIIYCILKDQRNYRPWGKRGALRISCRSSDVCGD